MTNPSVNTSSLIEQGFAHVYGHHVDTDVIIPARYLNQSSAEHLAQHCMIDLDAAFASRVKSGDILIAGKNFGCGSSREHAPIALKAAGISCVIAISFARIFLRNAINIGLQVIEADATSIGSVTGDTITIDYAHGTISNTTKGTQTFFAPPAPFISQIINAGGLLNYVKQQGGDSHDPTAE